jgi:hypothetical protein
MTGRDEIQWSPRVPKSALRRLYESDAKGFLDEDLLNDVGITLLLRCQDILTIYEAKQGRVKCLRCARLGQHTMIERDPRTKGDPRDEFIECPSCGWQISWGEYRLSHKRKQLNPGGAVGAFEKYVQTYRVARTPKDKMLAIDLLIHEFHYALIHGGPDRPVGVNLIQGKIVDVVEFLDELTYGDNMPEEIQINRAAWRRKMQSTRWGDLVTISDSTE